MTLEQIREQVLSCQRCELFKTKINYVFGEGSEEAQIMFIGEAPGASEDKEGRPFVGRAGGILDDLLTSINLNRDDIFICNILKCRPPENHAPQSNEIVACTPFLDRQIDTIKPKAICTLGNFATQYIMKKYGIKTEAISKLHGRVFKIATINGTIKIIPLYHPAVATYNPDMKKVLITDFKVITK
jgi:DNA polymerase